MTTFRAQSMVLLFGTQVLYNIHAQINEIEKVQKIALKIILDKNYISYEVACTLFNTEPLKHRRTEICTKNAIKLFKNGKSYQYFIPIKKEVTNF